MQRCPPNVMCCVAHDVPCCLWLRMQQQQQSVVPDCLLLLYLQASSQGHCVWGVRQRPRLPPCRQQPQSMQQQHLLWA